MEEILHQLSAELNQPLQYVTNVVTLLDEGNTIPFIARYRKELHGSMDDTALRNLADRLQYLRNLSQRRDEILRSIENQGKLTEELRSDIGAARTLSELEDLYRPYKPKRRTRATIAKEKGLEPLALQLFAQGRDLPVPGELAEEYLNEDLGVSTVEEALAGASDIIAEMISDDASIRKTLRETMRRMATVESSLAKGQEPEGESEVYKLYFDFHQPLSKMAGHQVLALNRGEREGYLKVVIQMDREQALIPIRRAVLIPGSSATALIRDAAEDAYDRLIAPSMERELRTALTDTANEGAIHNFALNLRPLLM